MNFHVPLNLLLDFHREQERIKGHPHADDPSVIQARSRMRRESPPDPLGMALNRLRLGEKLRSGFAEIIRLIQVKSVG